MNKGEWSEPYVLLKLLADGKLYLGDENFQKVQDVVYPILKILKHERSRTLEFTYQHNLVIINSDGHSFSKPITDFINNARLCFEKITEHQKGSLSIPEITSFLNSFYASDSAAKSAHKQDITIQIQDPKSFMSPALGFSIKSQLGRPSSLLNASGATNFTFVIRGRELTEREIKEINDIRSFSQKIEKIEELGGILEFDLVDHDVFRSNLQTIDTHFDKILAEMLLSYYRDSKPENKTIPSLVSKVNQKNPLNYNLALNPFMYNMMVKKFLVEYALGMRAAEIWQRDYQATGGYLVVRRDGEVLCYHFYFTKQFEEYLFQNTKLDTPSSSRHGFGKIYRAQGKTGIKLNLQIRFMV